MSCRRALIDAFFFLRLPLLGLTIVHPLIGAATVNRMFSAGMIAALLAALFYHIFGVLVNDLADIETDRIDRKRARSPLVMGRISQKATATVAAASLAAALGTDVVLAGGRGWIALGLASAAIGFYDLLSKRTSVPALMDAVQGLAFGALVYFGAYSTGGAPTIGTASTAAYVVVAVALINGIHAGVRDVEPDIASGAKTTAIALGVRPEAAGISVPQPVIMYGWFLQALLVVIFALAAYLERKLISTSPASIGIAIAFVLMSVALWWLAMHRRSASGRRVAASAHILAVYGGACGIAAIGSSPWEAIVSLTVFTGPLTVNQDFRAAALMGISRMRVVIK